MTQQANTIHMVRFYQGHSERLSRISCTVFAQIHDANDPAVPFTSGCFCSGDAAACRLRKLLLLGMFLRRKE